MTSGLGVVTEWPLNVCTHVSSVAYVATREMRLCANDVEICRERSCHPDKQILLNQIIIKIPAVATLQFVLKYRSDMASHRVMFFELRAWLPFGRNQGN